MSLDGTYVLLTKFGTVRHIPDWFPGADFKALAKETREKFKISIEGPMGYVKDAMKVSSAQLSPIVDETAFKTPT